MSFCRWSEYSHVYVYEDTEGGFTCYGCIMREDTKVKFNTKTAVEMAQHMLDHRGEGHLVPEYAIADLLVADWNPDVG